METKLEEGRLSHGTGLQHEKFMYETWFDASSIASDHPFPKDKRDRSDAYNGLYRGAGMEEARASRGRNLWRLFATFVVPLEREFSWRQASFPWHRCHCRESEWTANREECKSILENKSGSHIFPITASNFQWERFERLETRLG